MDYVASIDGSRYTDLWRFCGIDTRAVFACAWWDTHRTDEC